LHKLNACHAGVRMDSGEGYGRRLCQELIELAKQKGVAELYLLTTNPRVLQEARLQRNKSGRTPRGYTENGRVLCPVPPLRRFVCGRCGRKINL